VALIERLEGRERTPATLAGRKERVEAVRLALRVLAPDQREVVLLKVVDKLSSAKVADRLNVSRQTVDRLFHSGLKRLHDTLGDAELYLSSTS
jgi:RNA polymerase sigma factor (sigma-70 family)